MNDILMRALENNRQTQIELLQKLIGFPTTKGNEEGAQKFMAAKMKELGAEIDLFEPDIEQLRKGPYFRSDRKDFKGSPVLSATLKGAGGGKSIILSGHMDVVPADPADWSMDPFAGILKNDRIYGRGAADMKGGISCNYIAIKSILDAGIRLKGDVIFQTTIDEEVGNTGSMALCQKYSADAAIEAEPTSLEMNIATNGSQMFKIHIKGKAAHVGLAYNGVNALYKAIPIIQAVRDLEERRRIRIMDPIYANIPIPFCTNITMCEAGRFRSIIPSECVLTGRLGIAPSETVEEAVRELEDAIFSMANADPWLRDNPPVIEYFPSLWQSGRVDPSHPLAQLIDQNCVDRLGKHAQVKGMAACSDSGTYIKIGKTPSINFGPNSMDMAHQSDEYVDLDSLFKCADIIAQTVVDWCGSC